MKQQSAVQRFFLGVLGNEPGPASVTAECVSGHQQGCCPGWSRIGSASHLTKNPPVGRAPGLGMEYSQQNNFQPRCLTEPEERCTGNNVHSGSRVTAMSHCNESLQRVTATHHCNESLQQVTANSIHSLGLQLLIK